MFNQPAVRQAFAFRGGTALYKLHLMPPPRYSEDIDLVQLKAEPIGPALSAVRGVLDPWLGKPRRAFGDGRVQLVYRATSGDNPPLPLKLKIEVNTREHFTTFGHETREYRVASRWFNGNTQITTYGLEELLATKLRALYQRKKGRDLFDTWYALRRVKSIPRVIEAFQVYMEHEGNRVSRAEFEENLTHKMSDSRFNADIGDLLVPGTEYNQQTAFQFIVEKVLVHLPGEPWMGDGQSH